MAGADILPQSPYPDGPVVIKLGGYVPNGKTGAVIDMFYVPWNCYVKRVFYMYTGFTADLDAITLVTVDDTTAIVDAADMGEDLAMTQQTLADAIIGTEIQAGDKIKLSADSTDANEEGYFWAQIELEPSYSRPRATEH